MEASVFERIETRLFEWGAERNRLSHALGMPRSSGISAMIDRQKVFEQQLKGVVTKRPYRRLPMRDGQRARKCACGVIYTGTQCPACGPGDARAVGIALGNAPARSPQYGADTRSFIAPIQGFTSTVAQVQACVDLLAGWMQRALYRGYQYRQPDRIAARELHMVRERYTAERNAAVVAVGELLAGRSEDLLKFASPARACGGATKATP